VKTAGLSYIGRRSSNQDNYFCGKINGFFLIAVADGMGGHQGGEKASTVAIEALKTELQECNWDSTQISLKSILSAGFKRADDSIANEAREDSTLSGMGTTLTAVLFRGSDYAWASVGDSRCYLLEKDSLQLLTKDHTYLQQYIDEFGDNVPDEILSKGHILSKALNGEGDIPDIYPKDVDSYKASKKALFIVISDGLLTNKSNSFENIIRNVFNHSKNDIHLCEQLISFAYHSGSKDNCTVATAATSSRLPFPRNKALFPGFPPHTYKVDSNLLDWVATDYQTPKHNPQSKSLYILLIALLLSLGAVSYTFYQKIKSDSITFNSVNQQDTIDGEVENKSIDPVNWERGFANISTTNPFFDGDAITWFRPQSGAVDYYLIRVYQNNSEVYSTRTDGTTFTFSRNHGYSDGLIHISLYASKNGELFQPTSRSSISLTFNP
jgi:PPM family protein phosphatase